MQINTSDELFLIYQNLSLVNNLFENNIDIRKNNENIDIKIIDDKNIDYSFLVENVEKKICSAEWEFLGRYFINLPSEEKDTVVEINENRYIWQWSWVCIDDEKTKNIKNKLEKIPNFEKYLKNIICSDDPQLISYILSHLCYYLKYDYMQILKNDNIYSAFGIKNIKWLIPAPQKKEEEEEEEEIKENGKEEETDEKSKTKEDSWKRIIDFYAKFYKK